MSEKLFLFLNRLILLNDIIFPSWQKDFGKGKTIKIIRRGSIMTGMELGKMETNNMDNKRCGMPDCRKKLKLTDMECRCEKRFCLAHRLPETHNCSFNHSAREWSILVNQLMSNGTTENKKVPAI